MNFQLWLEFNEVILPKLFEKVKQLRGEYSGVHFSPTSELSFNYRPSHSDPVGIYVFPKYYVLTGGLSKNQGFASKYYAFLIEPTPAARILNLNMDMRTAEYLLDKMGIDKALLNSKDVYHKSNQASPGHLFWGVLEHIRTVGKLSQNVSWNTMFAKTGYNALYDPGMAIIHSNEPYQIVYLDHKAYKVLDVIKNENKHSALLKFSSYFPDFRIFKKRSGWAGELAIRLEKDGGVRKGGVEISLRNSQYNLDRLAVNVSGFGEKYGSKEYNFTINNNDDVKAAVEKVKDYMANTERAPALIDTSDYSFIKRLSEIYRLKYDPEYPGNLEKKYRNNTKFDLVYSPSGNHSTLSIAKGYSEGSDSWIKYFYYHSIEAGDPERTVNSLLIGLKDIIRKDSEDINSRRKYDAPHALKFVEFLENRVFVKRGMMNGSPFRRN